MSAQLTGAAGAAQKTGMELDPATREKALATLWAQSTTKPPARSLADATAKLEAFIVATKGVTADELARRVGADAELQAAAVAFLAWRLTPLARSASDPAKSYGAAARVAVGVVQWMTPAHRKEVLAIVFDTAQPAALGTLHPALLTAYTPAALEQAIVDHARSPNHLHAVNALSLPYYVYGRKPEYVLSAKGHAALAQRLAALKSDARLNAAAREILDGVRLPDPPAA